MSEALQDQLEPVLVRWAMGGSAMGLAPDAIRESLGGDPEEAEMRLLSLAGQALGTLAVPEPDGELEAMVDIPSLGLPTMPERLRPLAARLLARNDAGITRGVLTLLESRGHVVHPADWMPGRNSDVPVVYAPWQDWAAGMDTSAGVVELEWDELGPAGRRALLARKRHVDPTAAHAIIAQRLPEEAADARLWMIEALGTGLKEADRALLETVAGTDRAPRVREAARKLISRLGGSSALKEDVPDVAADMQDFFRTETKGMLRRRREIAIIPTRNHAATNRRSMLLQSMDLQRFCAQLDVAVEEISGVWPWGRDQGLDREFATMLLETGDDAAVAAFSRCVSDGAAIRASTVSAAPGRLDLGTLRLIANQTAARGENLHHMIATFPIAGCIDTYQRSSEWLRLKAGLGAENMKPTAYTTEMHVLGVAVTKTRAEEILRSIVETGIPSADPRLDALRLNAAL